MPCVRRIRWPLATAQTHKTDEVRSQERTPLSTRTFGSVAKALSIWRAHNETNVAGIRGGMVGRPLVPTVPKTPAALVGGSYLANTKAARAKAASPRARSRPDARRCGAGGGRPERWRERLVVFPLFFTPTDAGADGIQPETRGAELAGAVAQDRRHVQLLLAPHTQPLVACCGEGAA